MADKQSVQRVVFGSGVRKAATDITGPAEHTPRVLFRFPRGKAPQDGHASGIQCASQQDLAAYLPIWPVSYLIIVQRNEPKILSLALIDRLGKTIQYNLLSLADFGLPECVLLAASTRISTESNFYGARPSGLTSASLADRILPALSNAGYSRLYVRQREEGSPEDFFGNLQFAQADEIGRPFLVRELTGVRSTETKKIAPLRELPADEPEGFYLAQDKAFAAEFKYFAELHAAQGLSAKLEAHERLRTELTGQSGAMMDYQFDLARDFSTEFADELR